MNQQDIATLLRERRNMSRNGAYVNACEEENPTPLEHVCADSMRSGCSEIATAL